jgi:cytochrome c-type biogenesis protein CcmH
MRDMVRRRIAAGEKPSAIREWLIQRYGAWITFMPPSEPVTWPLWLAPIALLVGGGLVARARLKKRAAK